MKLVVSYGNRIILNRHRMYLLDNDCARLQKGMFAFCLARLGYDLHEV